MDKDTKSGGDIYALVAWADANRKQLIWGATAVVCAAAIIGLYVMHKYNQESDANAALAVVRLPPVPEQAPQFAEVANRYPQTISGARAMLIAGGLYFQDGQFEPARMMFQRLLAEHPDFSLADEASIGVAVCLEAEGKTNEAIAHYEEILHRPPGPTWAQTRSALARLYAQQNQPERAMQLYIEMLQARNNDSWTMEASAQVSELLEKYPSLRQKLAAQSAPAAAPAAPAATGATPVPVLQGIKP